jgi:hypothetical protein
MKTGQMQRVGISDSPTSSDAAMVRRLSIASRLWIVAIAFALSACWPRSISTNVEIRSVAVVVAFPDKLHLMRSLLFDNEQRFVDIDWHLADAIQSKATQVLASSYQINPLGFGPGGFTDDGSATGPIAGSTDEVAARLRSKLAPGVTDAVVVMRARYGYGTHSGAYVEVSHEGSFIGIEINIEVFDGRNFNLIAKTIASLPPARGTIAPSSSAHRVVEIGYAKKSFEALPPGARETARRIIIGAIDESIPFTFRDIRLVK